MGRAVDGSNGYMVDSKKQTKKARWAPIWERINPSTNQPINQLPNQPIRMKPKKV
jgi:hypothetical protein